MEEKLSLPGSSFDELKKVIKAYSHAKEKASLDDLKRLSGIHPSAISRSSKFLAELGLIQGKKTKTTTDLGSKLGRALDHDRRDEIRKYLVEAVRSSANVAALVTTVRIKSGMTSEELVNHILYVSGQKNTAANKTGARCLLEILVAAGLLSESDGQLAVAEPTISDSTVQNAAVAAEAEDEGESSPTLGLKHTTGSRNLSVAKNPAPQIVINIQLHLPETENIEIYEKLFHALRGQLLEPND